MSGVHGEARLRVRYAETDKAGVVYHSNFIVWFEVGRVELMRELGLRYADLERDHDCHIAVVDLKVRYKAPARYDDEILIRTALTSVRGSFMHFRYEVLREEDQTMLAEGETTHIVVDGKFERTTLPEEYVDAFRASVESGSNRGGAEARSR